MTMKSGKRDLKRLDIQIYSRYTPRNGRVWEVTLLGGVAVWQLHIDSPWSRCILLKWKFKQCLCIYFICISFIRISHNMSMMACVGEPSCDNPPLALSPRRTVSASDGSSGKGTSTLADRLASCNCHDANWYNTTGRSKSKAWSPEQNRHFRHLQTSFSCFFFNVCVQEEIAWNTSWPAKFQGWAAVGSSLPAMCQCLSDSGRASILSHLSTKLQSHPNNKGSRSGRLHGQARHWSRTV